MIQLVAEGLSNPDIASRLLISRVTVKTHLAHIFTKLDVINRTQLVALATRAGAEWHPGPGWTKVGDRRSYPARDRLARDTRAAPGIKGHAAAMAAHQNTDVHTTTRYERP